jgi:hypothetical protein
MIKILQIPSVLHKYGSYFNIDFFILILSYISDLVFNTYMQNEALSENTPVGQSVYKLEGVDSSGNDHDLLYGIEGTDYLTVDSNTGVVTVAKPLDHEVDIVLNFLTIISCFQFSLNILE